VRSIPIRVRVAGAFALAMAVVLAATGTFVYLRLGSHLSTALDNELRVRAGDLSALVAHHGSLEAAGGGRFVEHGEAYAELLDSRGRVLDATGSLGRVPLLRPDELGRAARRTIFADRSTVPGLDEPSRLLATPLDRDGKRLVLVVGATRQDRAETLASLRDELLIAGPIALLLATAAGFALAGLALRAVEAMRSRAATISAERPGERLPVSRTRDELERLGETLNAMLDRLEAAIAHERRFVADAGHELRTPLALLRTELELALRHGGSTEELRESIRVSAAEVDRLSQLADDLLLIARTGDGELALRRETLDVHLLFDSVVRRFEWRAAESGRTLRTSAPADTFVDGDRIRLEQALGNLVDNALRHGDGAVRIDAIPVDGRIELHVRDEGGGFLPDFLPHAFERFTQPSPDRGDRGAGLGLSIVQAIASAHHGRAAAAGDAADVWMTLPAKAAEPSARASRAPSS
jgi:signal transduction histidine kinase